MAERSFLTALLLCFVLTLPAHSQPSQKENMALAVIATPVVKSDFSDTVEALGTIKANETVVITADTSGKATDIFFEDGQEVHKDDILLIIDKTEEEAALRAAQAQLAEAQSSYDRATNLQKTSALSKATLQERVAQLERARAEIQAIEARIDKRVITAPFDGILGLREVSIGALIQPGDVITTIDDLSQMKVDFDVPTVFLSTLKSGMQIVGKVDAYEGQEFIGQVQTINSQIDPVTRTVKIRAIMPNPDKLLRPGLLITINLLRNERQALLIPEESLLKRSDKNYVFVITNKDGKQIATQREITIGTREPGTIEVLSGLNEGENIISHGLIKVRDGMEVTIRATETDDQPLDQLLKQTPQTKG